MSVLPRLTVVGNRLALATGAGATPTRLKGVNRSGFQYKPSLERAGMADPRAELRAWRELWGAQIVRFPLAQDLLLDSASYRADLERVVVAAGAEGLYLILELHGTSTRLDEGLPTAQTPLVWEQLARRYGAAPHVVFDLWNEPHDVEWQEWRRVATELATTIRRVGAGDSLLLVGGLDWAYDLSPLRHPPSRLQIEGPLAYATHPYPFKGVPPHGPQEWEERFGLVSEEVPVIVTEFGADDSSTRPYGLGDPARAEAWLTELLSYLDRRQLSALAWSAGDRPQLTLGAGGAPVALPKAPPELSAPTRPFGAVVRDWMIGAPGPAPLVA